MSTCCFCSNLVSASSPDPWNRPLLESENFAVIPSLGSLVEGWVLIVPKGHFICMGAFPSQLLSELDQIKAAAARTLAQRYGPICAFEHGPHAAHRQAGCGVDHAHLHLVPLRFDLIEAARPFVPLGTHWAEATPTGCRDAFENHQDYLYVEQPLGYGYIATHAGLGSQILRKAIAAQLGIPREFSWREHPRLDVVSRTVQALHSSFRTSVVLG